MLAPASLSAFAGVLQKGELRATQQVRKALSMTADITLQANRRSQPPHTDSLPTTAINVHDQSPRSGSTAAITSEHVPSADSQPEPAQLARPLRNQACTGSSKGANDAVPSPSAQPHCGAGAAADEPDNTCRGAMPALEGRSSPLQPSTECTASQGMLRVHLRVSEEAVTVILYSGERFATVFAAAAIKSASFGEPVSVRMHVCRLTCILHAKKSGRRRI